MASRSSATFLLAAALCGALSAASIAAETDGGSAADSDEAAEDAPTPAPLIVGSMAIASDAALAVENMAVDVATGSVTYAYRLHNKGKTKLSLAASVAMPDLEVNSEGNTIYTLPSQNPENPINLTIKSNNAPVTTTPHTEAVALGIDRVSDLKADHIPLIPFGPEIVKALAAAKPETLSKLESLGLVTPRDPSQPDTPIIADWSLHTVQGWMEPLEPNSVTNVTVSFAPIKATYHVNAESITGFNALKEQVCLTPQIMSAAKNLGKEKGKIIVVDDITLANDGPARWLDNPAATVAVRKPKPNSVIAFCGMAPTSGGQLVVTGKMPGSNDAAGLRILIFSPDSGA